MELDGKEPREDRCVSVDEFGGFDDSVGSDGDRAEFRGELIDGLVMGAVDVDGGAAGDGGEERAGIDGDGMDGLVLEIAAVVGDVGGMLGGKVEDEGAAESDIDDLMAAADGEQGFGVLDQFGEDREFLDVAGWIRPDAACGEFRGGVGTMDTGMDVIATGEEDAIGLGESLTDEFGVEGAGEDPGQGAGGDQGVGVAIGQADAGVIEFDPGGGEARSDEDDGATA